MADIVRGEAPESDEELNDHPKIFAAEVSGEATESDDEDVYEKSTNPSVAQVFSADSLYRQNLLQRKLIENNLSIWKALNALVKSFVLNASKQLVNTDQALIKSQMSMQSVLSSLKLVQANASQLQKKSEAIFTTNFIPNIRINKT